MTGTDAPMPFEAWVEQYSPVFDNGRGDRDDTEGLLVQYQTWTEIPDEVPVERRWAVIDPGEDTEDGEPGPWVIMPGYHLVNVVYFAVTREPWSDTDSPVYILWD